MNVWHWLKESADWISATLGLLSAAVFAWPGIAELARRRHMDALGGVLRRQPRTPRRRAFEDDRQDLEAIREDFRDERMGGYASARTTLTIAALLLLASFALSTSSMNGGADVRGEGIYAEPGGWHSARPSFERFEAHLPARFEGFIGMRRGGIRRVNTALSVARMSTIRDPVICAGMTEELLTRRTRL